MYSDVVLCLHLQIQKFERCGGLRDILLGTGDRLIAEASPTDRIWGIGKVQPLPLRLHLGHFCFCVFFSSSEASNKAAAFRDARERPGDSAPCGLAREQHPGEFPLLLPLRHFCFYVFFPSSS